MEEESPLVGDHWANFGDGNAARIIDSREYIKRKTGIKYVKFIFMPSSRIQQMYDIGEDQDRTGAIVKEYFATDVLFLERGIYRSRCWVYTDFNGGPTPASRRHEELTSTLKDTDRLLRSAEAAKNRAFQELEIEREQKILALRTQANMVREIARARGRVDDDGSDITADMPD